MPSIGVPSVGLNSFSGAGLAPAINRHYDILMWILSSTYATVMTVQGEYPTYAYTPSILTVVRTIEPGAARNAGHTPFRIPTPFGAARGGVAICRSLSTLTMMVDVTEKTASAVPPIIRAANVSSFVQEIVWRDQ